MQIELANLRRRDVDVIRARQVVVVGRAQEAEAVGERFEHSLREDVAALLGTHAEDLEDQLLLAHAGGAGDFELLGDLGQRGDAHLLHRRERDRLSGGSWSRRLGRLGDRLLLLLLFFRWGGGGGAYAAVCFGRLAIIFHSSSSPSPVRAETSATGISNTVSISRA